VSPSPGHQWSWITTIRLTRITFTSMDVRTIGTSIDIVMRWHLSRRHPEPGPVHPTFLLIGANKGGTTSLWHYLSQHPDVFMCLNKEPMYFSFVPAQPKGRTDDAFASDAVRTWSEYEQLFEPGRSFLARGEASTGYLRNPLVPARIHLKLPSVQLAAILRNPFDRALSHYQMYRRLGMEALTFSEAIEAELSQNDETSPRDKRRYLRLGYYGGSLTRYLEHFSRAQVGIYLYEDLEARPMDLMADLYRFIGVDPSFIPDTSTRHNAAPTRTGPAWEAELRDRYLESLEPDLQIVEHLIDRDLASWRRPSPPR
jgi:hypothetical protein